ncbi:hypothetical protein [Neptuniibacter marinus]
MDISLLKSFDINTVFYSVIGGVALWTGTDLELLDPVPMISVG